MMFRKIFIQNWWCSVCFVALIAMFFSWILSTRYNPEIAYWKQVMGARSEAVVYGEQKILLAGGSSASFSLHADIVQKHTEWPTYQIAGAASMGFRFLSAWALRHAEEGDIIVLHIEPDILVENYELTSAVRIASELKCSKIADGGEAFGREPISWKEQLKAIRPGAKYFSTLIGKIVSRRPLYRYKVDAVLENQTSTVLHESGTNDIEPLQDVSSILAKGVLKDLNVFQQYCQKQGVKVYYVLPWECYQPDVVGEMRRRYSNVMNGLESVIPVLREPQLGVISDVESFLDTGYHMTLEAGRYRSAVLGKVLAKKLSL